MWARSTPLKIFLWPKWRLGCRHRLGRLGAPGRILYSENAVDWEELSANRFTKRRGAVGASTESTSNAFFDGAAFNVFWGHQVWSLVGGEQWKETTYRPTNISHIRGVVFYPEAKLLLMRVERDENGGSTGLMIMALS